MSSITDLSTLKINYLTNAQYEAALTSNLLNVGQILQIPIDNTEISYQTYKIAPGDTLYSIARKYNTTVSDIIAINNDLSSFLTVGQVIKIPQ